MNPTSSGAPMSEREFLGVLVELAVVIDAEGDVFVGPCDTPERDEVAAFVVDLLHANVGAQQHALEQARQRPCDAEGVRRLPLGELLDALSLTARFGVPA